MMGTKFGVGLSTARDSRIAALDAASSAAERLIGRKCDLVFLWVSGSHLITPEAVLEPIHEVLNPRALIGSGATGVLGARHEIEQQAGVVACAVSFDNGEVSVFALPGISDSSEEMIAQVPNLDGASGAFMVADPQTFPIDYALHSLSVRHPGKAIAGGLSSTRLIDGGAGLFINEEVVEEGAVGVRFNGVAMATMITQATIPVGPELTITASDNQVISELAGRPSLEALREAIENVGQRERTLAERGLYLGIVAEQNKPDYAAGDFLVRGVSGADPESGAITIGYPVTLGQTVRLHVRDPDFARRDLQNSLTQFSAAHRNQTVVGGVAAVCAERGVRLFGQADYDISTITDHFVGAPVGGFFGSGEIAPLADEYVVHAYGASVAIFF